MKKILRIITLTIGLLVCVFFRLSADSYSQTAVLTLNMKNATIEKVLENIEQQSEFSFFYKNSEINVNEKISVRVENKRIDQILDEIFKNKNISYNINDKHIIIYKTEEKGITQNPENLIIKGTIKDNSGETLPGVSVVIKGTRKGTSTDLDGIFQISVPNEDAVLQFSFIGYTTQEIKIGTQRNVSITLADDAVALDEIIVTGVASGTPKTKLGFSIEKISSKKLENVPADNVASALQGKLAGVKITRTSGEPGSGYDIQLRAAKTISSGSAPLIIVDGILGGDMNISADDIASIEVLKGAAASSLYGSRAANGVINIMTKRGSGMDAGKVQVDYRTEFGKSMLGFVPGQSMSTNRIIDNGTVTSNTEPNQVYDNLYPQTFDHVEQFFNPGTYFTNYLSIRGNSSDQKISVYSSLQTTKEAGIVKLVNGANRTNVKLNLDYKISPKLTFTTSNCNYSAKIFTLLRIG